MRTSLDKLIKPFTFLLQFPLYFRPMERFRSNNLILENGSTYITAEDT